MTSSSSQPMNWQWLHAGAFFLTIAYAIRIDAQFVQPWLYHLSANFLHLYQSLGFTPKETITPYLIKILIGAAVISIALRVIQAAKLGWPIFKAHDRHSLASGLTHFFIYGAISIVILGLLSQSWDASNLDIGDKMFIGLTSYLLCHPLIYIDEIVSAAYIILKEKTK